MSNAKDIAFAAADAAYDHHVKVAAARTAAIQAAVATVPAGLPWEADYAARCAAIDAAVDGMECPTAAEYAADAAAKAADAAAYSAWREDVGEQAAWRAALWQSAGAADRAAWEVRDPGAAREAREAAASQPAKWRRHRNG